MSIEVRIPTILRSYTDGAKAVQASGDTLQGLIDDLDSRHAGIKGRLITDEGNLHRFVNVYVNDEDVRFLGSLGTPIKDGDSVTVIKRLKIKGSSLVVKVATKVMNIRLADGDPDIDCTIDEVGAMGLKSEFVRKV